MKTHIYIELLSQETVHVSSTFKSIFVDFYKAMRKECLNIGLNHTEICAR